jgi:hypothetical protein
MILSDDLFLAACEIDAARQGTKFVGCAYTHPLQGVDGLRL